MAVVVNSGGTLFASGGTLDLVTVVSGGVTDVGNGIVDIQAASSENVAFLSGGSGGLELAVASGYTGSVSGFGENTKQDIDLIAVTSNSTVTRSYSGNATSGVLTVTSAGHSVASIDMVGDYVTANFTLGKDASGHVEVTDPKIIAQQPGNAPATITAAEELEVDVADFRGR